MMTNSDAALEAELAALESTFASAERRLERRRRLRHRVGLATSVVAALVAVATPVGSELAAAVGGLAGAGDPPSKSGLAAGGSEVVLSDYEPGTDIGFELVAGTREGKACVLVAEPERDREYEGACPFEAGASELQGALFIQDRQRPLIVGVAPADTETIEIAGGGDRGLDFELADIDSGQAERLGLPEALTAFVAFPDPADVTGQPLWLRSLSYSKEVTAESQFSGQLFPEPRGQLTVPE